MTAYEKLIWAIEAVKAETKSNGRPLSDPQAAPDGDDSTFMGIEAFDLDATGTASSEQFKLQTSKWG